MIANPIARSLRQHWPLVVLAVLLLVVWPAASHRAWRNLSWPLHGLPAFFAGLVGLCLAVMVSRTFRFLRPRANDDRPGASLAGTLTATLALTASTIVLFYTVERWRGRHAWAAVATTAAREGVALDLSPVSPEPIPADQDFAQAPILQPLDRAAVIRRDADGRIVPPDLGALKAMAEFATWLHRYQSGVKFAEWLEGHSTDLEAWLHACRTQRLPHASGNNGPALSDGSNHTDPTTRASVSGGAPTNGAQRASALLAALAPLDAVLEALRPYADRPECRLPFDHELPYFSEFHGERVLLGAVTAARLRATARLALGEHEAAFADARLGLQLARHLQASPTLFTHRRRAVAMADALQPVWEGCVRGAWNAAQLAELQQELARRTPPIQRYRTEIQFVALANAQFCEAIVPTAPPSGLLVTTRLAPEAVEILRWVRRFYPVGWSFQNQAIIWEVGLHQMNLSPFGTWGRDGDEDHTRRALVHGTSDPFFPVFIVPRVSMMYSEVRTALLIHESTVRLGITACGLERQRLAEGGYPATLEALLPGFLPERFADSAETVPLRYVRADPAAFRLYALGSDGTDDGGRMVSRRREEYGSWAAEPELATGDWVWSSTQSSSAW